MPRPLRPIDDGLIYHVINRGNNRQDVFHKPADFQAFLAALADLKERKPFELFGYCLLNNHFHLLLRPKGASISRIMQSLLVSHTQRYHRHYRSGGHIWQGRFKSPVIQNDEHLLAVLRYIEANPLRVSTVLEFRAQEEGRRLVMINVLSPAHAGNGSQAASGYVLSGFGRSRPIRRAHFQ
jgi:putative transposase